MTTKISKLFAMAFAMVVVLMNSSAWADDSDLYQRWDYCGGRTTIAEAIEALVPPQTLADIEVLDLNAEVPDGYEITSQTNLIEAIDAAPLCFTAEAADSTMKMTQTGSYTAPVLAFVDTWRPRVSKIVDLMAAGKIPERVTHNDTKINNVLVAADGTAVVIDLDTVMPGSALYDFGDMVRTSSAAAAEDEMDLSAVYSIDYFRYWKPPISQ